MAEHSLIVNHRHSPQIRQKILSDCVFPFWWKDLINRIENIAIRSFEIDNFLPIFDHLLLFAMVIGIQENKRVTIKQNILLKSEPFLFVKIFKVTPYWLYMLLRKLVLVCIIILFMLITVSHYLNSHPDILFALSINRQMWYGLLNLILSYKLLNKTILTFIHQNWFYNQYR